MTSVLQTSDLVLICWEDSAQPISAWMHLDADDLSASRAVTCWSVGYEVYASADVVVLAPNVGECGTENEQASGLIRIPQSCVVSREVLRQGVETVEASA